MMELEIELKDVCPPDARHTYRELYQLSPAEYQASNKYIEENLAAGKIRPRKSPYASPIFFEKDKDGKLRGIVYHHDLNLLTNRNKTVVPKTD